MSAEDLFVFGRFSESAELYEDSAAQRQEPLEVAEDLIVASEAYRRAGLFQKAVDTAKKVCALLDDERQRLQSNESCSDEEQFEAAYLQVSGSLKHAQALRELPPSNKQDEVQPSTSGPHRAIYVLRSCLLTIAQQVSLLSKKTNAENMMCALDELKVMCQHELSCALSAEYPAVAFSSNSELGLHLVAACDLKAGDVVLQEQPLLVWEDGERDDRGFASIYNTDLIDNFQKLSTINQQTILTMCIPPMPPNELLNIQRMAKAKSSNAPDNQQLPPSDLVKLMMVSKINAHQLGNASHHARPSSDGAKKNYCCLFDTSTKLSHSCAPNVIYRDGVHTCIRETKKGEPLAFSYFSSDKLTYSTDVRRDFLGFSHMFHCSCERCRGVDYSRGMPCVKPCSGTRYRDDKTAKWSCDTCGEVFEDWEMPTQVEDELGKRVHELKQKEGQTPTKGQFETLKETMTRVIGVLGRGHWCYSELCWLMGDYFAQMMAGNGTKVAKRTQVECGTQLLGWYKLWFDSAKVQRLHHFCPLLVAQRAATVAERCSTIPELSTSIKVLWRLAHPMFTAVFPADEITKDIMAKVGNKPLIAPQHDDDESNDSLQQQQQSPSGPSAMTVRIVDSIPLSEDTEDGLLKQWEDYLIQRVLAASGSSSSPSNVSPAVLQMLQRQRSQ